VDCARLFVDPKDNHERPFQGMGQHWKYFRQQTIAGRQLGEAGLVFVGKVKISVPYGFIMSSQDKCSQANSTWVTF
jgi:hypothetical protein